MRMFKVGALIATLVLGLSASAQAATITFDNTGLAGGSFSYGGAGGPVTGSGIGFNLIVGSATPLNSGAALVCSGCTLSFTSGANTSEGPMVWTFGGAGAGSFVVSGGVPALGIAAGSALLTGSVTGAVATNIVADQVTLILAGPDTKHAAILAFFGLTGSTFTFASTNIDGAATVGGDGSFSSRSVDEADIVNTSAAAVPEPLSLGLFSLGLFVVGARMRARQ